MERELKPGTPVIFVDSYRQEHAALLTNVFFGGAKSWEEYQRLYGAGQVPCVNLLCTSLDETKTDPYGRQIERHTSVSHASNQPTRVGYYWRFPDEA